MRTLFLIPVAFMLAVACGPSKKIQKTQEAISKADTTEVVIVTKNDQVDSAKLIRDVYKKVLKNEIDFNTFSAKVKVDYEEKDNSDNATAFVRIQKDSLIWMSLRGALGIEGARVKITQDSVIVLNMLKKEISRRSIGYLQELTELPVDFYTLQDLIIGNPVFADSNIVSYSTNENNELMVLMSGKFFKHLATLDGTEYKLLHSKLDDADAVRNRTCDITFTDYDLSAGVPFAAKRIISIAGKSKLDIHLDFKSFAFNQATSFPMPDTKNFKAR